MKKLLLIIFFSALSILQAQQGVPMWKLMAVSAADSIADSLRIPLGHVPAAIRVDSIGTAAPCDATFKVCVTRAGNGPWYTVTSTATGDTTAYSLRIKKDMVLRLDPTVMAPLVGPADDAYLWLKIILSKKQTYAKRIYMLFKPLF